MLGGVRNKRTLSHKLGGVDLGSSSDDFTLPDPLLGSGGRERLLELDGEVDVLEQNRLNSNTPLLSGSFDLGVSVVSGMTQRWNPQFRQPRLQDPLGRR